MCRAAMKPATRTIGPLGFRADPCLAKTPLMPSFLHHTMSSRACPGRSKVKDLFMQILKSLTRLFQRATSTQSLGATPDLPASEKPYTRSNPVGVPPRTFARTNDCRKFFPIPIFFQAALSRSVKVA